MKTLRYIDGVVTLSLSEERCIGCGMCIEVCPHGVFVLNGKKAKIRDKDGCMECGACAMNCSVEAIKVTPGVGCASLIINRWLKGKNMSARDCC
jgi:NAD-dependent dihydropyrimidine dehydrogenase PreA subunit